MYLGRGEGGGNVIGTPCTLCLPPVCIAGLHTDLYLMLKVRNMGWLTCFSILYSLYLGLVHVFFNKNNKRPVFQLEVNQFLAKQAQPNHIFQFTFGLKFNLSCNA